VSPVNDAPVGADGTVTTLEDSPYTFQLADFAFSDPDDSPADNLLSVTIVSLPVSGTLLYEGAPVLAGQTVEAYDISLGELQFAPAANENGLAYASFTFQIHDSGGVANGGIDIDPTSRTLTINVTPANDTPVATGIADVSVNEDAPGTVIDLFAAFADMEDADTSLIYAIVANTNPGLFSATTMDGIAGTLSLGYVPDASGSASITVRATDTGGLWAESTFDVTVNPVNDAPTLSIGSLNVAQGETVVLSGGKLSASDADNTVDELTYVVTALPAEGTLALNGTPLAVSDTFTQADVNAGLVTYIHAGATATPDSLGIKVVDTASAEASGLLSISVSALPPSLAEAGAPMPEPEPAPATPPPSDEATPAAEEAAAPSAELAPGLLPEDDKDDEKSGGFLQEEDTSGFTDAYRRAGSLNPVQVVFNGQLSQNETTATTPLLATLNRALDAIASDMNALESLRTSLGSNDFQQQLNQLQDDIRQQLSLDKNAVASTLAVSTGLSVGYVLWLVRGGVLLSSLLTSLPAWRLIDPLPILAHLNRQKHGDEDDDSLEGMLKKAANKAKTHTRDTHAS
jgi:hypothetical protein